MKWAGMKYKSDLVLVSRDECCFALSIAKLHLQVHTCADRIKEIG